MPRTTRKALLGGVLLTSLALLTSADTAVAAGPCSAATRTWDGGAGTSAWTDAANWTGDVVPLSTDVVCVAAGSGGVNGVAVTGSQDVRALESAAALTVTGTLDLAEASIMSSLTLSGALSGPGTATITDTLAWDGGGMRGSGTTVVAPTASLTTSPGRVLDLRSGRTLRNEGSMSIGDSTLLYSGEGSVLRNTGTLALGSAVGVYGEVYGGVPLLLSNTGVIAADSATATSVLAARWDNDGSIALAAGRLDLRGLGEAPVASGSMTTSGTATIALAGGSFELGAGASGRGVDITGGEVGVSPGVVVPFRDSALRGGSATGPGTLSFDGASEWTGGQMQGPGTTTVAPTGTLTTSGLVQLRDRHRLLVEGAQALTDGTLVYSGESAVLRNTGTVTVGSGVGVYGDVYSTVAPLAPLLVQNTGTVRRTGAGSPSLLTATIDNDGLVEANQGDLSLNYLDRGAPSQSGTFGAMGTARLLLASGQARLGSGAAIDGATISGATVEVVAGTRVPAGRLRMTGGRLSGAGDVDVSGDSTWSGGAMAGSGTTRIVGGALRVSGLTEIRSGRTIVNRADLSLEDGALVYGGESSTLVNEGTMTIGSRAAVYGNVYASADPERPLLLRNGSTGVLTSSGDPGTTALLQTVLDNDGVIDSRSGVVQLSTLAPVQPGQAGTFSASGTGTVELQGNGVSLAAGGALRGATVSGARVAVEDGATVEVQGAHLLGGQLAGPGAARLTGATDWSGLEMTDGLTADLQAGASLSIEGFASLRGTSRLASAGALTMRTGSALYGGEDAVLENRGTWDLEDGAHVYGNVYRSDSASQPLSVTNTGVLRKTTGAGTAGVSADLRNDGHVLVSAGLLQLQDNGGAPVSTGRYEESGTGALSLGRTVLGEGAELVGLRVQSGDLVATGSITATDVELAGGSISGTGDVVVAGTLTLTGGVMSGAGATIVPAGAALSLPSGSTSLQDSRVLATSGSTTVGDGSLFAAEGVFIDNAGTWTVTGDGTVNGRGDFGGSGALFHNAGVLRKTGGAPTTLSLPFDNSGTVRSESGTLRIADPVGHSFQTSSLTGGTWAAVGGSLDLPSFTTNAARLVLDGPASRLVTGQDALLERVDVNAGSGRISLLGGAAAALPVGLRNSGQVRVGGGSSLTTAGTYEQVAGTTRVDSAGTLSAGGAGVALSGGTLSGAGTVGPRVGSTGGRIAPGGVGIVGTLTVAGDLTGTTATSLLVDLDAAQTDRLDVTGAASLSGRLQPRLRPGFTPTAGSSVPVVVAGSLDGVFSSVAPAGPSDGLVYRPSYDGTTATLAVARTTSALQGGASRTGTTPEAGAAGPDTDTGDREALAGATSETTGAAASAAPTAAATGKQARSAERRPAGVTTTAVRPAEQAAQARAQGIVSRTRLAEKRAATPATAPVAAGSGQPTVTTAATVAIDRAGVLPGLLGLTLLAMAGAGVAREVRRRAMR